jgi:hypothetical protein
MSDLPVPNAGGSYLRDDTTGELTRVSGRSDEIAPANPPDVPQQVPAETPPDVPSPAEEQ